MPCRADGKGTGVGLMTEEDYRNLESQHAPVRKSKNEITICKLEDDIQSMEEDLCIIRDLLFIVVNYTYPMIISTEVIFLF